MGVRFQRNMYTTAASATATPMCTATATVSRPGSQCDASEIEYLIIYRWLLPNVIFVLFDSLISLSEHLFINLEMLFY